MALKKALYNADLFIADNSKPTHRESRTNSSDNNRLYNLFTGYVQQNPKSYFKQRSFF